MNFEKELEKIDDSHNLTFDEYTTKIKERIAKMKMHLNVLYFELACGCPRNNGKELNHILSEFDDQIYNLYEQLKRTYY